MKKNIKFNKLNITISILFLFLIILTIILFLSYDNEISIYEKTGIYSVKKTYFLNKNNEVKAIKIPQTIKTNENFELIMDISEYLKPKEQNSFTDSLFTKISYADLEVYADNKLIYSLKKTNKSLTKSNGYCCILFDIPRDLKCPYITMKISPNLKRLKKNRINPIVVGRKSDILIKYFVKDLFSIILSLALIINFLIIFILTLKHKKTFKEQHYALFHLAIFGLILAAYFLMQSQIITYLAINIKEFLYFIEFIAAIFIQLPFLSFIKYKIDRKFKKYYNIISVIIMLNAIIQISLTLLKIIEFKEMLIVSHTLIFITIIMILIGLIFTNSKKYPVKKLLILYTTLIMTPLLFSVVCYIFYDLFIMKKLKLILILAVIIIEYIEIFNKYKYLKTQELEKELYKKLAMNDALTGLLNRQAYNGYIDQIKKEKISGWFLSIDINSLKYINDKLGHLKGDALIKSFAKVIKTINEQNKNIYAFRIGGDEFIIFVKEKQSFNIKSLIRQLDKKYKNINTISDNFTASFSAGYSYYDSSKDIDIADVYNEADKMMYKNKAEYKKSFRMRMC